jgi:cobalt/nickel transport system ATP-binding protein
MIDILKMEDVLYRYEDDITALNNISFTIDRGDSVAILGPNGAGKSTLMKLAAGLLFPDSGKIELFGEELTKRNAKELRKNMGILFQDPDDQIFMPKVKEDVAFGPINLGKSESEVRELVKEAMKKTGLEGFEDRVPHHLSYGEKKRVAIAGILAMEPKVLLLDEPTANLDPKGRVELMEIIKKSCDTLVCATHDINIAAQLADKIIILNHSVILTDSAKEVFRNAKILRENNLEAPEITRLFLSMQDLGYDIEVPLSNEEAILELKKKIGKKDQ